MRGPHACRVVLAKWKHSLRYINSYVVKEEAFNVVRQRTLVIMSFFAMLFVEQVLER